MYAQVEKPKKNKSRATANSVAQKKSDGKQGVGLVGNRGGITKRIQLAHGYRHAKSTPLVNVKESAIQCMKLVDAVSSVGKDVKVNEGLLKDITGKILKVENDKVFISCEDPEDEGVFSVMDFEPNRLDFITSEESNQLKEKMKPKYSTGELKDGLASLADVVEVMNKVAGDNWMVTGSVALNIWSSYISDIVARNHNDVDILVHESVFQNVVIALNNAFGVIKTGSNPQYGVGEWALDIGKASDGYGNIDEKIQIGGVPLMSLDSLQKSKLLDLDKRKGNDDQKEQNAKSDLEQISTLKKKHKAMIDRQAWKVRKNPKNLTIKTDFEADDFNPYL